MSYGARQENDSVLHHIGRGLYLVEYEYQGVKKVHLRYYNTNNQGQLYPSKNGIALSLESVVEVINLMSDLKEAIKNLQSKEDVAFHHHIGCGNHLSINASYGHPVHVRRWFKLDDMPEAKPTKTGVTLKVLEIMELEKALKKLTYSIPNLMTDNEHPFHNGQLEHFTCKYCCPYGYKRKLLQL